MAWYVNKLEILIILTSLYFASLVLYKKKGIGFCPLCQAVFITWFSLFVGSVLGYVLTSSLYLLLLAGSSITGIYYTLVKKPLFDYFSFPLFLLLFFVFSSLLSLSINPQTLLFTVSVLLVWVFLWLVGRKDVKEKLSRFFSCCRDI